MPKIRRAVAYARYSSNNQREESIDAQLRAINDFADRENIHILQEYFDEAQTGKNDSRDDFQRMINAILKGHIEVDAVLVHKFNRFARNKYDSALYKKRLQEVGVRVVSVTQKIDDTAEGAMLEGFLEVIDEYYSANLALEVKKGLKENALKGKYTGGKIPYGLRVDSEGYYCPDLKTAPVVKRMFEMYANGIPKAVICETLNAEGLRNQYGRMFNTRTLDDMLKNEKYVGIYIYNHTVEEIIKLDDVIKDPIIDFELWEKVAERRNNKNKPKYREQKRYYYMTGKAVCGCCGSTYCGAGAKKATKTQSFAYYKCSGKTKARNGCKNASLNKDYYEGKILKKVLELVFTPEAVQEIAERVYNQLEAERKAPLIPTTTLKKQLAEIKRKEAELLDLKLDSKLSPEVFEVKEKQLVNERRAVEKNIQKNKELESSFVLDIEKIKSYIIAFKTALYDKQEDKHLFMKAVFDTFVDKIIVNPEEIEVKIKVDFSAFDFASRGDNKHFRGAIRAISPLYFNTAIRRKKHNERLN